MSVIDGLVPLLRRGRRSTRITSDSGKREGRPLFGDVLQASAASDRPTHGARLPSPVGHAFRLPPR